MAVKIRKATLRDVKACAKISHVPQLSYLYKASDSQAYQYLKDFVKKGILLVAEDNHKIIGFAAAEFMLGDFTWFDCIVVEKNSRYKGIGKLLFKSVVKELKKKKISNLFLIAPIKEKKTLKFYKTLGLKRGNTCAEHYFKIR